MKISPADVPVPKKMRALQRDRRGYPVPYIVLRDTDGKPHFAINDDLRRLQCVAEKRCPICGTKLSREMWFVGGPLSAFHNDGCYNDTAMHYECMDYALRVCPYLAMPSYLGRIDAGTLDPAKLPDELRALIDPTQLPDRPALFVAVMARIQMIGPPPTFYVKPARPYKAVEYWKNGEKLSEADGSAMALSALQSHA
jgi:hypothetical protein